MKYLLRRIPIALLIAAFALTFTPISGWGFFCDEALAEEGVEYDFMEDCYHLPNQGNSIESTMWADVEDGEGQYVDVTNAEIVSQHPREAGKEVVTLEYDKDVNAYFYNCENYGWAEIKVTYNRVDGQEDSYSFKINCVDTLYMVSAWSADGRKTGLPGDEFTIASKAVKEYTTKDEEGGWNYHDTSAGLKTVATLGEGSEFATIDTSGDLPVVRFNDLPEGEDTIGRVVEVKIKVIDQNPVEQFAGEDEQSVSLYVTDNYDQIEPTCLADPDMAVGKTETFQAKLRHYSLDNRKGSDVDGVTFRWEDPDVFGVELTCTEDGLCTVKRTDPVEQSMYLVAEWNNENGEQSARQNYRVNDLQFCTHEDLTKNQAVKATLTKNGNKLYYVCNQCGEYFSDAEATNAIEEGSWVIPARKMTVKAAKSSFTVKATKVKKKSQTIKAPIKVTFKSSSMKTKLNYKLKSVVKSKYKKYFSVAKSSGKLTVKKGLKKGTYTVKVKVTAASNTKYAAASKIVSLKVKVK